MSNKSKEEAGLCWQGHKCGNEESILSLLDKGMLLKAEDFVVDVFKTTEFHIKIILVAYFLSEERTQHA